MPQCIQNPFILSSKACFTHSRTCPGLLRHVARWFDAFVALAAPLTKEENRLSAASLCLMSSSLLEHANWCAAGRFSRTSRFWQARRNILGVSLSLMLSESRQKQSELHTTVRQSDWLQERGLAGGVMHAFVCIWLHSTHVPAGKEYNCSNQYYRSTKKPPNNYAIPRNVFMY